MGSPVPVAVAVAVLIAVLLALLLLSLVDVPLLLLLTARRIARLTASRFTPNFRDSWTNRQ